MSAALDRAINGAAPRRAGPATPAAVAPPGSGPGSGSRSAAGAGHPIASETLFAGAREVLISHHGFVYRLKQTALGKLILTK